MDGTPDGLAYINGLLEAGYVDPDTLTLAPQQALDRALEGRAGMIYSAMSNMRRGELAFGDQGGAEWVQIYGPSGPGGGPSLPQDTQLAAIYALPASLEDEPEKLEAIFAVMNFLGTEKGQLLATHGIEGQDWEMVDGEPEFTEEAAAQTDPERGFTWMYQLAGREAEVWFTRAGSAWSAEDAEFALSQPTLRSYSSLVTAPEGFNLADAQTFTEQNMVYFISGERPIDEYDAFVQQLYGEFGYQAYADAAATQIAELVVE